MCSANARVLLVCCRRVGFFKRFTQSQAFGYVCPNERPKNFATCSIHRKKNKDLLFTPVNIEPRRDESKIGEELTGKISRPDILKIMNKFFRLPELKLLSEENGLSEELCQKGIFSFRRYCIESESLPPDLHIVFSDIIQGSAQPLDIFPYFMRHVKDMYPHLDCMEDLKKIGDIQQPAKWYPEARALNRKFYFHSGPTNSGKTYQALQSFYKANSGIYCAPLKLLALEIHQKTNSQEIPCDLFTGEEVSFAKANGEHADHLSCTIEMCPLDRTYDVAVIDEIQMLRDTGRGWAWTRALLGLRAKEIHLCGEEAAVELVDSILCTTSESIEVLQYERLTGLHLDQPLISLKNVQPGDCIVCFNKNDIYSVAKTLESFGHSVAVVYGSLPPHTKLSQCKKFNDPNDPCNVLVATDAVGMGLNLNIRRIVFYTLMKQTEFGADVMSVSQALQIAGRAGRHGTNYSEGYVTTLKKKDRITLQNLLEQKPEKILHAGLLPSIDQIELFSYYLPKSHLSELIGILGNLSTIDNSLYFLCDLKDLIFLAQLIDHVSLPLRVKYVFCCAPVNKKVHFSCVMFIKYAKMVSQNQAVNVKWVCDNINWPLKKPKKLSDLALLECYYDVLDMYLWLSNRFEEYFPDANIIGDIQKQVDSYIHEGVLRITRLKENEKNKDDTLGDKLLDEIFCMKK